MGGLNDYTNNFFLCFAKKVVPLPLKSINLNRMPKTVCNRKNKNYMTIRKIKTIALCAFAIITVCVSHTGCRSRQVTLSQNIPLITLSDSLWYAWAVIGASNMLQSLEQRGILSAENTDEENAPKLNEFLRGLERAATLSEGIPYALGLYWGIELLQTIQRDHGTIGQAIYSNFVLPVMMQVLRNQETTFTVSEANDLRQREFERAQIAAGNAFLAENARRQGVITLPSGLQYKILREGHGVTPTSTDRVRVHYHGTLLDGTVFDSSMDRGQDITFGVTQVIAGWQEALQLMPVGSKWRLFIPYDLAYGAQDRGIIRPFSVLIFDVELLGIE